MAQPSFLSDVLRRIAGNRRRKQAYQIDMDLIVQCQTLLDEKGEAAGLALAAEILDRLEALEKAELLEFFLRVADVFGVDDAALQSAIDAWSPGDTVAARHIHFIAEPRSQNLIRVLNRVPGATRRLVSLRAALLDHTRGSEALKGLDDDFRHLFVSWFNRGFLEIRQIDWSTPAEILEKIIRYEAVHEIEDWDDLRQRVGDRDRRLFAFFHPAMASEPLIFVEVALTQGIPSLIRPILSRQRARLDPQDANTAVFYSISNCQKGLAGISFGNFLIKQVVSELQREFPHLEAFVTLSPIPGLRSWVEKQMASDKPKLAVGIIEHLKSLGPGESPAPQDVGPLVAFYLTEARRRDGRAFDSVANFHLGNGATLKRVNPDANPSEGAMSQSWGAMVNYYYAASEIESNHQIYTSDHIVVTSPEVSALLSNQERRQNLKGKAGSRSKPLARPADSTSPKPQSQAGPENVAGA